MPPSYQRPCDDAGRGSLDESNRPQSVALVTRQRTAEQSAAQALQVGKNLDSVLKPFVSGADHGRNARRKHIGVDPRPGGYVLARAASGSVWRGGTGGHAGSLPRNAC